MADAPQLTAPPLGAPRAWWQARGWKLTLRVADPVSLGALYIYQLAHSWLRWGDPLVDFPRSLYVAWRLNEGDLLYHNVVGQYGPLAYLVQAAGFHFFGVGLDTMVWMNIAVATAAVLLLRAVFRALGGRLMGWLAALLFINIFVFGGFTTTSNYNFIAPYSAQAIYGFVGLLLVLWGLLRYLSAPHFGWLALAGWGWAVTYLDKPEILLAASVVLALFLLLQTLWRFRQGAADDWGFWLFQAAGGLAGGALFLWLPVFGYFLYRGGLAYAFFASNYATYTITSARTLHNISQSPMLARFFGFDAPLTNFTREFLCAGILVLGCAVTIFAARRWTRARTGGIARLVWPLVAIAPLAAAAGQFSQMSFWLYAEKAFVLPVCVAAAVCVAASGRAAWRGQADFGRVLGLAVVGVAASLMLARMILNARFNHFGFFMMPLAVCFLAHGLVVESSGPVPGQLRANYLARGAFSVVIVLACLQLARLSMENYDQKTYELGVGRDHFYAYAPSLNNNSWMLRTMLKAGRSVAPDAKTLAVFPGGVAVNYHLRLRSPLSRLEVFPLAITVTAVQRTLNELAADPPDMVMLYARDLSENGALFFGADKASGRDIIYWLRAHYKIVGVGGQSPFSFTHHGVDLLIPVDAPNPGAQTLSVDTN